VGLVIHDDYDVTLLAINGSTKGRTSMAELAYSTSLGVMYHGDSIDLLRAQEDQSVNLVLTSPPFALTRKKPYGNTREDQYTDWFETFAKEFLRILRPDGSLVIDLGGSWLPKVPARSLYQFRLLLHLCDQLGFFLAEDFYWFNRAKLPGPHEWVTRQRIRVKDAVNNVWWLSKTPNPKADNRRILNPYSESMKKLLERKTYNNGPRPSEHSIGQDWARDNGGAIPPNVIEVDDATFYIDNMLEIANTSSRDAYQKFCRTNDLRVHPARSPRALPDFFIRFLTEPGDIVLDPFAGSNMTGAVAEQLNRRWISCDRDADYVASSLGRFTPVEATISKKFTTLREFRWE
jgi:DNA modification methylase